MKQLSSADAFFVYSEAERTPMQIGGLSFYDPATAPGGRVEYRDVLAYIRGRLPAMRAFRQRLVRVPLDVDYPYWIEDAGPDLDHHVRRVSIPKPGGWRELCSEVARIHAVPLDMSKPLWEFVVIDGLRQIEGLPPDSFALVLKVHHALIDGAGGAAMSTLLHDPDPTMTRILLAEEPIPEPAPWSGNLLVRSYLHLLAQPARDLAILGRSVPALVRLAMRRASREPERTIRTPHTRFNAPVTSQRVWDGVSFPLGDLKRIKATVFGATINDVILAIVGGALRSYLGGEAELPDDTLKAMVPISTRKPSKRRNSEGNHVSAMTVNLGTHLADPEERLQYVHAAAASAKGSLGTGGAESLALLFGLLPPFLTAFVEKHPAQLGTSNEHRTLVNCVVTNIPGSPDPLYFAGARLLAIYGIGPIFDGLGLMNIANSCGSVLTLSFTSDPAMMPDPVVYAEALRASFEELLIMASVQRRSSLPIVSGKRAAHQGRHP